MGVVKMAVRLLVDQMDKDAPCPQSLVVALALDGDAATMGNLMQKAPMVKDAQSPL